MTQYIQYDEEGNITAAIIGFGIAPEHPRQLMLDTPVDVAGKKIDVETGELVEIPAEPLEPEE